MGKYQRGATFERHLLTQLWQRGWASIRAAGSGTRIEPVPDVLAAKNGKLIIIEAKTTKNDRLSLKTAILQLADFAKVSGGDSYIAVRFFRKQARFYPLEKLLNAKNFTIRDTDEYLEYSDICRE